MQLERFASFWRKTGYRVDGEVTLVSSLYPNPASSTNRVHTFWHAMPCWIVRRILRQGEEGMSVTLVSVDDIVSLMQRGEIGQAMHVAASIRPCPAVSNFCQIIRR